MYQIKKHFDAYGSVLSQNTREPFMHRIVTCDQKSILYDNPKQSASCLDSDKVLKHGLKPNVYEKELIVNVWWSSRGLIHYSFIKPGQSITAETYSH